ncbi:MAG: hypothetical protein ACREVQ_13300 [Burkholderiales bacterium]
MRTAILALLAQLLPAFVLAEPATVVRAVDLKKAPASDAATLAPLAEGVNVEALERQGGWTRIKAASGEGWVRMLALRYDVASESKRGDLGIVQAINVARTGTSGTQVTTGVRGLDEKQLAAAQPNAPELKKLEGFGVEKSAAAKFASAGKLEARTVAYPKAGP